MSDTARNRILTRLTHGLDKAPSAAPPIHMPVDAPLDRQALIEGLKTRMEAVKSEIHVVPAGEWFDTLHAVLVGKNIRTLLYGPGSRLGKALDERWETAGPPDVERIAYREPVEGIKETLFQVDAGITGAAGAVADTGAIILRPDTTEPRLLSLVPPVHIAVLDVADIYPGMRTAMETMHWADDMPTNLLLVSGPSKTADIEFTLAFGVHGPKALIVIIRT